MPDETGFRSSPGSGRAYRPPVFTQWTEGVSTAAASDERVAPPFVPGLARQDGVPPDASMLPDDPTPAAVVETASAAARPQPAAAVADLAARLERLADRLRADGAAALGPRLDGDDRLDALLTGLLAGYLAGRHE